MKSINNINLNNLVSEIKGKATSFEINPLDMNLAEIQHNLIKRLEREVPEYGDFAPVTEKYDSKNPLREFGTIKVECSHIRDNLSKTDRALNLTVTDKANTKEFLYTIAIGDKQKILEAVNEKSFFQICKNVALKVDEKLKG